MRTMMIAGLLAILSLTIGAPGLSITPAGAADMMKVDSAMMKKTAQDLRALKMELASIQAELNKINARHALMVQMANEAARNHCVTVPGSDQWGPGLCE